MRGLGVRFARPARGQPDAFAAAGCTVAFGCGGAVCHGDHAGVAGAAGVRGAAGLGARGKKV